MIPQSLKVTSDLCKYLLSLLITYDRKLYDKKSDTPAGAANTSICEDLGQIEYLFTDKTGTLTENIMIYRKCIVDGVVYEAGRPELEQKIRKGDEKTRKFIETIALCNTVFSSINEQGVAHYRSHSPDEEALVNYARDLGFVLLNRDRESIKIREFGVEKNYTILQTIEFTSSRRRMSIIIQSNEGTIYVLSKGADDVIFSMLDDSSKVESYKNGVKLLANDGLRTMCMAYKTITQSEYDEWAKQYEEANGSMDERAQKLEKACALIESDMTYIGCSGIEDALQEGVAETIQSLREAGIVVWMLTGDKKETAIMIGYSSKLIDRHTTFNNDGTHIFDIEGNSVQEVAVALMKALEEIKTISSSNRAIIIDGATMKYIFPDSETSSMDEGDDPSEITHSKDVNLKMLSELAIQCKSVICCRMSPIQKGRIVRMMKGSGASRRRCLAIGDGGNDVTMILESDVGVGISGKEVCSVLCACVTFT